MPDSILERMVREKQSQIKKIDKKVEEEQIVPTRKETGSIAAIINSISEKFRKELTNPGQDKNDLDEKIRKEIETQVEALNCGYEQKKRLEKIAVASIIGLGPIQQYLEDPEITEVIVQRYNSICIEKGGKVMKTKAAFMDEQNLRNVINRILQPVGREVNLASPIVDAHLSDGSRICATIPPVSPKGATLTIRKFNNNMMTAAKYVELKSISVSMLKFLEKCVRGKVSIFVSGGTGTGKTTFLNMLSSFLPKDELIITVEDTLELQLKQPNVRSLETRPVTNGETMKMIDMDALVKATLRMRPDRVIVGETRDGAVVSLLSMMSTGHEGSMTTGHANSPENLVNVRIPIMIEMNKSSTFSERQQKLMITEAIQMIIQLRRLPNGRRVVSQICEVGGVVNGEIQINDICRYDTEKDCFIWTGYIPKRIVEHAEMYGIQIPEQEFARRGER